MVKLRIATSLAAVLIAASTSTVLFASSVSCDSGSPDISIATLTGANVCTLGPETLFNFKLVNSSGFSSVDIGINNTSSWDGTNGDVVFDVTTVPQVLTNPGEYFYLTYQVTSSGMPLDEVELNNFFGSGEVIYEDICEGDTFAGNACGPNGKIVAHLVGLLDQPVTAHFAPSNTVSVEKFIALGDASISQFSNSLGTAPEPVQSGLIGISLVGIAFVARRRRRSLQ